MAHDIPPGRRIPFGTHDIPGLVGARRVQVYVAGRHFPGDPRPTIVMFDGQNVFDDHGSYSGGWFAHEAVDRFAALRRLSPVIVAIDHGGTHRIDELTPLDARGKSTIDTWLGWVAEVLLPQVAREFGTTQGPSHTALCGSSMGGLAALYGHLRFPKHFGRAISMSPAYWVAEKPLFDFVRRRRLPAESRVYVDCGAKEGERMMGLAGKMAQLLKERGYGKDALLWRPDPRGKHHEAAWKRRLPMALRFAFRRGG